MLEKHGGTANFDKQCARLKDLLQRARSADEDDQFEAATRHASQILLQLKLGRSYLRERDELDGTRSPALSNCCAIRTRRAASSPGKCSLKLPICGREVDAK